MYTQLYFLTKKKTNNMFTVRKMGKTNRHLPRPDTFGSSNCRLWHQIARICSYIFFIKSVVQKYRIGFKFESIFLLIWVHRIYSVAEISQNLSLKQNKMVSLFENEQNRGKIKKKEKNRNEYRGLPFKLCTKRTEGSQIDYK